jgi:pyruvate/2-oxoglutarate dehydrogenase complex dihydrolipoamide dehydrogenase (E3) component
MLVVGSGPIGCELGQSFARLGTEVTILERGPSFLPRDDPDAVQILQN